MNILHLYSDSRWTGPAESILQMCKLFQEQGHRITFACRWPSKQEKPRLVAKAEEHNIAYANTLKLNRYWSFRSLSEQMYDIFHIRSYVRANNFDIVHTHLSHDFTLGTLVLANQTKAKLVYTNHHSKQLHNHFFQRLSIKSLDAWIDQSQNLYNHNKTHLHIPPSKHFLIPPGINIKSQTSYPPSPQKVKELGLNPSYLTFGIVARLQRRRCFFILLKAFKELSLIESNVQLILMGRGGKHRQEILHWIDQMDLQQQVCLAGYRDKDYQEVLNLIDIKVMLVPGFDGTSRATLEAMSLGKPLLVSNSGILPEYVPDSQNGLVSDLNQESLLQAMLTLAKRSPQERQQMGQHSYNLIKNTFSIKRQVRETEQCYQKLLE